MEDNGFRIKQPAEAEYIMRHAASDDDEACTACGGALDTGWECNECGKDCQSHYTSLEYLRAKHPKLSAEWKQLQ